MPVRSHRAYARKQRGLNLARIFGRSYREPAAASALCFSAAIVFAALIFDPALARGAGDAPLAPDAACAQIRDSVRRVAKAERNEALALHLMADGKPTPIAQARLTELQAEIGNLRETLKRARKSSSDHDAADCIEMGSQSLSDAEHLSKQIEDAMGSDAAASTPQIKSGGSPDDHQLPEPPLPGAKSHEE